MENIQTKINKFLDFYPVELLTKELVELGYIVTEYHYTKVHKGNIWTEVICTNPKVNQIKIRTIKDTPYNVYDYSSVEDFIRDNSVSYMLVPMQEEMLRTDPMTIIWWNQTKEFILVNVKSCKKDKHSTKMAIILDDCYNMYI